MALLRKDLKLGFLAGGTILVLGVGYVLVTSFFGSDNPPPTDPLAFNPDATLSQPADGGAGGDAGATSPVTSSGLDTSDEWGGFGQPLITRTPTPSELASGTLPPDAPIEPVTPDLNTPQDAPPSLTGGAILNNLVTGASNQSVITGASASASEQVNAPAPAPGDAARTHEVASGENLSSIAQKYYGDASLFSLIQNANPTVDSRRLRVGQVLNIPNRAAAELEKAGTVTTAVPSTDSAPSEAGMHVVQSGETLSSIANKLFGRAALWQDIYDLNRDVIGSDPASLKVGMKLKLPK